MNLNVNCICLCLSIVKNDKNVTIFWTYHIWNFGALAPNCKFQKNGQDPVLQPLATHLQPIKELEVAKSWSRKWEKVLWELSSTHGRDGVLLSMEPGEDWPWNSTGRLEFGRHGVLESYSWLRHLKSEVLIGLAYSSAVSGNVLGVSECPFTMGQSCRFLRDHVCEQVREHSYNFTMIASCQFCHFSMLVNSCSYSTPLQSPSLFWGPLLFGNCLK